MACGSSRLGKVLVVTIGVFVLICSLLFMACGCGESPDKKQKEYKSEWTRVMDDFEARVEKDDKKAQKMIEDGDTAGVIKLLEQRIDNVWDVYGGIVVLYPPDDLRNLHALTLYDLTCIVAQLQAQNALNEAILSGKPTEDLKTIADQAAQKTQYITTELALEVERQGIKLESMKDIKPQVQEQEQGTTPANEDQ